MKKAFTLIELLVVVAIIAILMGILLPVMGRSRLQAKILCVNAELREIGMALESYSYDHDECFPPTRVDCASGDHFYQLPTELVDSGYLPRPTEDSPMAAGIQDRFNPDHTYKYWAVGDLIYNRTTFVDNGSKLWIPDGFPYNELETGTSYDDPKESPVTWVLFSQGPHFDINNMRALKYPVPTNTWYDPKTRSGVLVRARLQNGTQIGSFE